MDIVFGTKWFEKHQQKLLWLLNTPIIRVWFRYVMRIRKYDCNTVIHQITPNSFTFNGKYLEDRKVELTTDFRTHNKYAKRIYYAFKPFWYILHFWDFATTIQPQLNLGFDTLTQYPGSIGAYNPINGDAFREGVDETFTTIQTSAAGGTKYSIGTRVQLNTSATTDHYSRLVRALCCFDTSALTSGATISAATYSMYPKNGSNGLGSPDLHIAGSTPASTSTLATGDYLQCQQTSFGSVAYASWNPGSPAYRDITLNASGIANISKTGISKFSVQLSWDITNTPPTWAGSALSYMSWQDSAEANPPKLVVTYTVVTSNIKSYNTNLLANIKSINTNVIANVKSLNTK
ncbi:hypothetical protein M0R04_14185, partial [Candidatus Dojkabacteria bacterium]|nr:hypothetical protein [Candidatus Dojkabacteria bacterium]